MVPLTDAELDDLLAAVWERNLPVVLERLAALQDAADALIGGGRPGEVDLEPARVAAHQLGGSLGTMGHPWASEVALGAERLLADAPTVDLGHDLGELVSALRRLLKISPG